MHIAQFIPHGAISSALIFAFVFNYSSWLILDETFSHIFGLLALVNCPVRQFAAGILFPQWQSPFNPKMEVTVRNDMSDL